MSENTKINWTETTIFGGKAWHSDDEMIVICLMKNGTFSVFDDAGEYLVPDIVNNFPTLEYAQIYAQAIEDFQACDFRNREHAKIFARAIKDYESSL